jgi:hypothetical protein
MTRNDFPINQLQSHQQPSSISQNHGRAHTLPPIQKSQMQVPQQSCCSSRCIPQGARNHGDDAPSAVSAGTIRQFFRYACRGIPWCLFTRLCWDEEVIRQRAMQLMRKRESHRMRDSAPHRQQTSQSRPLIDSRRDSHPHSRADRLPAYRCACRKCEIDSNATSTFPNPNGVWLREFKRTYINSSSRNGSKETHRHLIDIARLEVMSCKLSEMSM